MGFSDSESPGLDILPTARHRARLSPGDCHNSSTSTSTVQSLTSASTLESKLDFAPTEGAIRKGMLQESFFPAWQDDATGEDLDSPEEMRKKDPLGTRLWKLYSRTKTQLPNQERLENLTWRMMSMNLKRQEEERKRSVGDDRIERMEELRLTVLTRQSQGNQPKSRAPSGIAQLRRSVDQSSVQADTMNLDDFLEPSSVGSPSGVSLSPASEHVPGGSSTPAAIPIMKRKEARQGEAHLPHASAPVPQNIGRRKQEEFGYVQRRVRKTSIDERRV